MEALVGILESLVIFAAGLVGRLGIVLAAMAALLVPALLVWGLMRGAAWLRRRSQGLRPVGGVLFRPGLLYADGHTWVRRERGAARVGLDDLAQRILPWVVSVRLPRPGAALRARDPAAVISAGGREAVVRAPIDGTVVAVNDAVALSPSLVKSDGYASGWLFRMKPAGDALGGLRSGTEAEAWMASEGARLHGWLEGRLGLAAADGGELLDPVTNYLAPEEWDALVREFL